MSGALVDNDIAKKAAAYSLLQPFYQHLSSTYGQAAMLAVARFYIPKLLARISLAKPLGTVQAEFAAFITAIELLEPTEQETVLAAEIELVAKKLNLAIDVGESQLMALAITRGSAAIFTGDKRAIADVPKVLDDIGHPTALQGAFVCFEQLLKIFLANGVPGLNSLICAEPQVDTVARICFQCSTGPGNIANWIDCLDSNIQSLRAQAGSVLSL